MIGPTDYRAKRSYSRHSRCITCVHNSIENLQRVDFYFSNDTFLRKVTK